MKANLPLKLEAALREQMVLERSEFLQARMRAKARLEANYDLGWNPASSREELYDR